MKKMISIALLLVLLLSTMAFPGAALADSLSSYKGNTKYAGWYTVYRVKNALSVNNKPENSSHSSVTRLTTAKAGERVYITDAQASAGTAKKWGKVTQIEHKNGTIEYTNGYACMYYLKSSKSNSNSNPAPVREARTYRKSNVILDLDYYVGSMKITDEMTVVVDGSGRITQHSCNSYFSRSGIGGMITIRSSISAYNVQSTYVEFEARHELSGAVSVFRELGLTNQDTFVCSYRLDNQGNLMKLSGYWR